MHFRDFDSQMLLLEKQRYFIFEDGLQFPPI